jgi:hypothetical protein
MVEIKKKLAESDSDCEKLKKTGASLQLPGFDSG